MTTPDGRYGDEALGLLLQEVIRYQTDPHDYHIKLFGGSHMYPEYGETRMERIGADNVLQGRHLLAAFGLAIMAQHVGGTGHRILIFEVWSGDVWVRYQPHTPGVVYNQASGAVR
jgi:chemotaxis protein CheD